MTWTLSYCNHFYDFIRHGFHFRPLSGYRLKARKRTIFCIILSYKNTNLNPEPGPDTFSTNYNFIVELSYYGYVDNGNRIIVTQIIQVWTQNIQQKFEFEKPLWSLQLFYIVALIDAPLLDNWHKKGWKKLWAVALVLTGRDVLVSIQVFKALCDPKSANLIWSRNIKLCLTQILKWNSIWTKII